MPSTQPVLSMPRAQWQRGDSILVVLLEVLWCTPNQASQVSEGCLLVGEIWSGSWLPPCSGMGWQNLNSPFPEGGVKCRRYCERSHLAVGEGTMWVWQHCPLSAFRLLERLQPCNSSPGVSTWLGAGGNWCLGVLCEPLLSCEEPGCPAASEGIKAWWSGSAFSFTFH